MRVRIVHPPVLRDLLLLAAVGVVGALFAVACAPDSRDRMMHFFFEIPDKTTDAGPAATPGSVAANDTAFGGKWPQHVVSRHPPFLERRCQVCHDPDNSNTPRVDQLTGCKACHPKLFEYRRYGHGPAVNGSCVLCHNMHLSLQDALLQSPQAQLCTSCHAAQDGSEALDTYHRDIESRDCTACHDPHGADNPGLLTPAAVKLTTSSRKPGTAAVDGAPIGDP